MLNYVWLGLLMLGVGIALTTDLIESNSNKYRNGEKLPAEIVFSDISEEFEGKSYEVVINIESKIFIHSSRHHSSRRWAGTPPDPLRGSMPAAPSSAASAWRQRCWLSLPHG